MAVVPESLAGWTSETLAALCAAGQAESDRHDFKFGLPDSRSATKICCAFANTFGGFLVVGIRDHGTQFRIEGIEPNNELYGQLIAKVQADPDITIALPKMIGVAGSSKLVYVFEVPQSPRRPHLPRPADWRVFWKRNGSSCEPMTLEEVRYQMSTYEEKREKLALLLLELNHMRRSLDEQASLQDGVYTGSIFVFDIIDRVVVESYALLKTDPGIFGALDTLKKQLMTANAEKQKLLNMLAQSYSLESKVAMSNEYRAVVQRAIPLVHTLSEQIERSIEEKFGIENPHRKQT